MSKKINPTETTEERATEPTEHTAEERAAEERAAEERAAEEHTAEERAAEERAAEAPEAPSPRREGASRAPDQRARIQTAVDNLVGRRATADDYAILTDRAVMYHATMGQAMDVIEALQRRTDEAPVEVLWAAAVTLCIRVKQSPAFFGNRSASRSGGGGGGGQQQFRGPRWSHHVDDQQQS